MNRYERYVNLLFVAGGLIVWFISRHYVDVAIGYFQLGRKIGEAATVIHEALPVLMGLGTFLILRANSVAYNFTTDAVSELVKVSWPSTKEVRLGTIVVIITVVVAGIVLGLLDLGLTSVVRAILNS